VCCAEKQLHTHFFADPTEPLTKEKVKEKELTIMLTTGHADPQRQTMRQ
jgi:hypothetical protein